MRVRTFISILVALLAIVSVAYLTNQNVDLLGQPFRLAGDLYVPLYAALVTVFLLGFLPVVTLLLIQTLKQDLSRRRQRRFEREAQSWQASFRRAVDLQEDEQWSRAAIELERVLADQPDDFSTLLRYGEVLRQLDRVDEALDVHRRASVLFPQSTAILLELIEDYEAGGEGEVADEIRERLLRDFPGVGLRLLRQKRDEALARRDWDRTTSLQDKIDALHPGAGGSRDVTEFATRHILRYQEAVALMESERLDEAETILVELTEESPDSTPPVMMLAEIALVSGDPSLALQRWREVYDRTGAATVLQRIEDHFIERGEPLRAIETLRAIIASADDDLLPRFFLGQLYARLEMLDDAIKVLEGIRPRVQDSPALFRLLGELRHRRGDKEAAAEAYRLSFDNLGLSDRRYVCAACKSTFDTWDSVCFVCGTFGLIELQVELDTQLVQERPMIERPTWPVYDREEDI